MNQGDVEILGSAMTSPDGPVLGELATASTSWKVREVDVAIIGE